MAVEDDLGRKEGGLMDHGHRADQQGVDEGKDRPEGDVSGVLLQHDQIPPDQHIYIVTIDNVKDKKENDIFIKESKSRKPEIAKA